MGRYSKITSKYILAKHHQDIEQGTLYERDWTTIGNIHRLEPGKRPYYGDGNFLFTESTIPVFKKKRKTGKWVGEYTYEDVKDASSIVNQIKVNTDSDNLADYAYWGSMTELFRGSVEHIISTFPGRLRSTNLKFSIRWHRPDYFNGVETWVEAEGNILANPFGLDMHNEFEEVEEADLIRYVALTWQKYVLETYGENNEEYPISYYDVIEDYFEYDCPEEHRYYKLCYIVILAGEYGMIVDVYVADGKIVYVYRTDDEIIPALEFAINYYSGLPDGGSHVQAIEVIRSILESNTSIVPENFSFHPNSEIIEQYFRGLTGFEWKLLNRTTNPLYQNIFLYPSQGNSGNWYLTRRVYTWPSEGYCIDIESTDYDSFVNNMIDICEVYDNLWCDSIWRCMVHESIKNFDWSYRREYDDSDEADNIEGGNRMKEVMRLYGIIYDTAKRYVDGIRLHNNITYDGYNNCPSAQISDRNALLGWDITSTQHQFYWYEEIPRNTYDNFVALPALPINVDEDSPEYVVVNCKSSSLSHFYQKATLNLPDVKLEDSFFTNSTTIQKQSNPWVNDNVYGRLYIEVGYGSIPANTVFDQSNTYNEFPYALFSDVVLSPYIKVAANGNTKYYKLISSTQQFETNNQSYVNNTWFTTRREASVSTETSDILFNRMLNLSGNRILKSKGTKESIEMVMALFGFGVYDNDTNPYGDFTIEEQYQVFSTKDYDATFYFYEEVDEETTGGGAVPKDEMPLNPTQNSDEYISIVTTVGNASYTTYYKLNSDYTIAEVIKELYAHRMTAIETDDYYYGVPIKEVYRGNNHLIVPFYDRNAVYDGDLYFEAKGGWLKDEADYTYEITNPSPEQISQYVEVDYFPTQVTSSSPDAIYIVVNEEPVYYNKVGLNKTWAYSETIPYLHILQRISDLLAIEANNMNNGDIYFVADVSDYYTYNADVPYYLSNYFKLKDKYNSTNFSSWVNIPIDGPIRYGYSGNDDVTIDDYRHVKHLDNIIPTILFNNPHCGYDRYDLGDEYKDYMQNPYKYSVSNYLYDDDYYRNMASQFHFDMSTESGEKMDIIADTVLYGNGERQATIYQPDNETIKSNDKYLKITLIDNGLPIDTENSSYRMHLEYFRNVVMKYVTQVVPSTTILVLENFVPAENQTNETGTITVNIVDDGMGVVYGEGTYLKSTMVTLKAVPKEGYHFVSWMWYNQELNSRTSNNSITSFAYTEEISVMVCGDKEYTATFAEDCGIGFGCVSETCINWQ